MAASTGRADDLRMAMSLSKRWISGFAFVFLSALLVVTASERVYWYVGGVSLDSILGIAIFYMIPTLAGLWALGSGPSIRLHQVVLAGAIFGFVVEGVLTAVVYEDGVLPIMAALFVGWHGLLSVVAFWYLTRRWLLARRRRSLVIGSAAVGLLWGIWSIVYTLPEASEGFEAGFTTMDPGGFAIYALVVGLAFAAAHYLIGYVWPKQFQPGKWGSRGIVMLLAAYAATAVLPAVPWAPIKFAILVGGSLWLLRRSREAGPEEPSAIAALQGHVRLRDVVLLLVMPVVSATAYSVVWSMELSTAAVEAIFTTVSLLTVLAGLSAFGWAARCSLRRPAGSRHAQASSSQRAIST
ncbi:MAG: hypothetical protein QNJ77_07710 [Acidimicrobiia bacterium]|nr:hypothetical protein [Acidimicrobiia bacterium]